MNKVALVDMDGTLVTITPSNKDTFANQDSINAWDKSTMHALPYKDGVNMVRALYNMGYIIMMITARGASCRPYTIAKLKDMGIYHMFTHVWHRHTRYNGMPSGVVKAAMIKRAVRQYGYDFAYAVEDENHGIMVDHGMRVIDANVWNKTNINTHTKEIAMFNMLVDHVQGTGVLWHLAPASVRASIQANGILPGTHNDPVWLYVDKDYTPSDYDLVRSVEGSDGHYTYRTSLDLWAVQATPEVLASMQLDTHLQDVAPYSAVVVPCVSLPATLHTPCHRRAGSSTRDPINRPVSAYKESINQ